VVLAGDVIRKKRLLEEIFSSYINLDVTTLADFRSLSQLRKLIQLLARRIGTRLNINELANIIGVSRQTIESHVEFLEATYLIKTIPIYTHSVDVRQRSLRKVYFVDTGIANVNADLSSGSKLENTVRHQLSFYGQLSFFQKKQKEIDFILETGGKLVALEVKETPVQADLRSLKRRAQSLNIELIRLIGGLPSARFSDYLWAGLIG